MALSQPTYVELDVYRQDVTTYVDLTPAFQGRVGDSRDSVSLRITRNHRPLDLTNKEVELMGVDPQGKKFHLVGYARYDQPGANQQAGKVNFYFPAGTFQTEGRWDTSGTYFIIRDKDGTVSTVNVLINVLSNMVEMGINAEPFETDLDRALAQFKSYLASKQGEVDKAIQQIAAANNGIKALQSSIDTYKQLITANAVPTKQEMQTYVNKLMSATEWSGDLNLCLTPTTYLVNSGASNNPGQGSGSHMLIVKGNSDVLSQLLIDSEQNLWVRSRSAGRWSDWREQVAWS
ncbi:BppU family phage baseplate upper protein [Lactobacillaceae bacterium 24-114]